LIASKKVLIITYYWPPAGGPGVQRWLKFTKYLPDFGIEPIVYVPENPTYPITDANLVDEVPREITVLKTPIFEPYQLASVFSGNKTKKISSGIIPNKTKQTFLDQCLLWIRGNFFIPDARVLWVKPSVKYLEKYIIDYKIDTIITTGPPHSLHLIGLKLKSKLQLTWFADFRDPWTTIGYHKELKLSDFASKKHKKLELEVLNYADTIIVTSPSTKVEFQKLTAKPIEVITNGFDIEKKEEQNLDIKFSLAHIGSFLSQRNPLILWESLAEIINEMPDFKNHLQLKLAGTISQEVLKTIAQYGLNTFVDNVGYVSHEKAIEIQKKSQILLLIEINSEDTKSIIPGKLFEYMASERPIIGIGPKNSDFETIIKKTNTGIFVDYEQKALLKKEILNYYSQFLKGNLKSYPINLDEYSRKNLTEKLASLLNKKSYN
jgi:hypothetical protein